MDYKELWSWNRVEWLYQLARSKKLGASAVRVGLLFGTFMQAEDREEVRPSYEWIMENARVSRPTLAKALAELEAANFICIERFHRYRSAYSMPFDGHRKWAVGTLSKET